MKSHDKHRGAVSVRPSLVGVLVLLGVLGLVGTLMPAGVLLGLGVTPRAVAQPASTEPTPQTDASVPARNVMMIGSTEAEAPGEHETWGIGTPSGSSAESAGAVVVRYTRGSGWSLGPPLPSGFKLEQSPLAGQMTPQGDGVLAGTVKAEAGTPRQVLLVRKPGGAFTEAPPVPAAGETLKEGEKPLLGEGETLFGATRAPLIAPLDEEGGEAGALLVPVREGAGFEDQVLHFDGHAWTSESIDIPEKSKTDFRVLALGASSPESAWLLAQLSSKSTYPAGAVALFRRVREGEGASAKWVWKPVTTAGGKGEEAEPLTVPVQGGGAPEPFTVAGTGEPPAVTSQILTVTSEGVWVDGERADVHALTPATTTMFFKPGGALSGQVTASWCLLPAGVPGGTPLCEHELPEVLPTGPSRSFAWSKSEPSSTWSEKEVSGQFGARVITGLHEGVSLRLEGEEFVRVLALGATVGDIPGGALGAAFSSSREGWLGVEGLPVHLTTEPAPSRLKPWQVPFRHALTAAAPQPGVPIGSLSSEALVVGDQGEVARFTPGEGWLPESLFGPGERVETPRLRAVAWPTPARAYAVGDEGAMWLWRGETGLWERDPATPINFRGNLLGIAFQPGNPSRGFAVGSPAVAAKPAGSTEPNEQTEPAPLLRYGKTWVQEAPPSEAPCSPRQASNGEEAQRCNTWADASFTSIAFAGSEAIVTYRILPNPQLHQYSGGLLVNNGSGWQIDHEAATVIGANAPVAVAGLSDGGAAFETSGLEGTRVFERESASASWQATPTPLPSSEGGSLALFREGGALRAIAASGGAGTNFEAESEPQPPPGIPPNLIGPSPISEGAEGSVLRQTATGWSDESHELNPVAEPEGNYIHYDLPYRPEPVLAVLVNSEGTQGWAVGGEIHTEPNLDTSSIERYPAANGETPPGEGESQVPVSPGEATFTIGGGAECAASCVDRERAGIGPDVWLSKALARAGKVSGVRAFIYTGPRVTKDEASGLTKPVVPFARELDRYAQILRSGSLPVYAAPSPQDLDARPEAQGTEATFEQAFGEFPEPLGHAPADAGLAPAGHSPEQCANAIGCEAAYYALNSEGPAGTVRVIVLDDSRDVNGTQRQWLSEQLANAKASGIPAIVVGNADLNAQIATGDAQARAVAEVLVDGDASAYFYDSPEENVGKPLRAGGGEVPTFGSGTLGYVNVIDERAGDFHGASGFLLVEVNAKTPEPSGRYPVHVRLIPSIGELALEAKSGILLRRSEPALFDALARRPRAGNRALSGGSATPEVDPYIPIPSVCIGQACPTSILPEYTFTSSNPEVGGFVRENLASPNPHITPLQGPNGKPISDEPTASEPIPKEESGLFCAYNPGTTIVSIEAGGLKSSLPVTVQAGSVRQPCGTVPLKHVAAASQSAAAPVPPPSPAPAPVGPSPAGAPPVVPVPSPPPAPVAPPPSRPTPVPPTPFFIQPALPFVTLAFVPVPPPAPAEPTPPSGTSAVTSPVEAAQKEEEEEEAPDTVSNKALAYSAPEHEPSPVYILGIVLLAAFAGASVRRRPRRGRRELHVAPATISSMRAQRRIDQRRRRKW